MVPAVSNNGFGRPNCIKVTSVTYEQKIKAHSQEEVRVTIKAQYMFGGGLGNIRREHVEKKRKVNVGAKLLLLGDLHVDRFGGGAASSMEARLLSVQ